MCATHPRYGRYPTVMHEGEALDPNQYGRVNPLVLLTVHWNEQASHTIPLCPPKRQKIPKCEGWDGELTHVM